MAKKISSKDLFESEDIFKGIRDSAEKTLISLNKINDEFKQTATTLKQSLGDAKFDSSDSIKKFTAATAEANKIQKQAIEIEKLKEQVRQQAIKSEKEQERLQQERIKTQKAEAIEKERLAKQSEKQVKAAENEASAYKQLEKATRELKNQSKELGAQLIALEKSGEQNTAAYVQLEKQFVEVTNAAREQDKILKDVDKSVGDNFRNVGNYEGATKNLKTELRALTKELMNMSESDPKFQQMAQRAGELKDQIQDTQAVVKATAGSAMENFAGSVAKVGQVGIAAFQGIESSMVLLGVENENILASMQKLQALAGLGDALKTLGGLGDALTEIRAGFTATLAKMGLLTAAKEADTVATVQNTVATEVQTVATTAQGTATTATTGATKLLGSAMKMLPIVAIAAAIGAIIYGLSKWASSANELSARQKALNATMDSYKKAAVDATAITIKVGTAFNEAKKGVISKEKALKIYNDSLGATFGTATSLNEAEKMFAANTKNYVEASALRAQADTLIQMSAEKRISLIYEEQAAHALAAKAKPEDRYNIITMAAEGARKKADQTKKEIAAIDALIADLSGKASGLESKFQVSPIPKKEVTTAKDNANEIVDLRRSIEDEQIKSIKDENQRAQTQLIVDHQRRIEDTEKTVADKTQKAKLIKEIENNLLIELDKMDQEFYDKQAAEEKERIQKEKEDADKKVAAEKVRKENLLNQEEEFLNQYQQAINTDKQNEINSVREKYFSMIEMAKQRGLDTKILEEKLQKELSDINKKYSKSQEEADAKRREQIEAFADKTTQYFKKKSEEKVKAIEDEITAAEKQAETLKQLAAEGNINAQQSLAEQQRIINEANLKKQKELKKQMRMEQGLALFKLLAAKSDEKNPLGAVIKDATGLLAFINSLPAFYDGTENTGSNGQGIDGKGGFHAVLHPNERVVPKSLNDQIGSMSNEQLAKLAQEYQNGRLVSKSNANSSLDLAILANKLDTLTDVIKNKPETNIALGEITQSAMNIVESKRTGNTTVYNRFKVRK